MLIIRRWFNRYFNNPQAVGLAIVLLLGFGIIIFFGRMLAPVLASLVLAYLLEGLVRKMERWGLPRLTAVALVFTLFFAALILILFALLPILTRQTAQLVEQIPSIVAAGQELLMRLPQEYPAWFSEEEIKAILQTLRSELMDFGQRILASLSLQSVVVLITFLVYLVLVPFLIFFFLKDKEVLVSWFAGYLPRERTLAASVWREVDQQIGNYIRGKFIEIFIVWLVTYATFAIMGLQFAMLLAVMVGLSVIVPYVGAAVVTLPIAAVAYFQFGLGSQFVYIMVAYAIIQALDGNVLVPILFSEVVDLHPVAIIIAILVFGGIWGFWGVFFAIPLATLTQAILKAFASLPDETEMQDTA
ncbi:AI-2E family transporter [Alkalilimnicola ehrlichii]|uniref:AI-2E family transporter n=1 Tax=Alkalilimnicola ehrlichii TaxID=351052 RepID=A0A3E0X134_9GAMM|nr:AI-2E family transporter [Alkalilimnicola ehrlichii]RFA31363.1 AI-2E family transporter [Alkalilimnicola ehrlichii]RFA39363.1 AI-2E family transporter [Alkalilimnicola ehrlichii]